MLSNYQQFSQLVKLDLTYEEVYTRQEILTNHIDDITKNKLQELHS